MQLSAISSLSERPQADVVVLLFWRGEKKAQPASGVEPFQKAIAPVLQEDDFQGKEGEIAVVYSGQKKEKRILLLGCGKASDATAETLRRSLAVAVKWCRQKGLSELSVVCPEGEKFHVPITEGILLANYVFTALKADTLKDDRSRPLQKVCLIGLNQTAFAACKRAHTIVDSVNFARDLVNGNADDVTPQMLSKTAVELSRNNAHLKATILGKKELTKAGMHLLLAVAQGAARDPALICLEYRGNPASKKQTALVGKGITYDTGGLNLKPTGSMETMKCDMSGAAAVLGTLRAAAALKLPVNIIGVVASAENAIGPASYKPGDVYSSYSGKTVEITNTDAEGRLVLADAISYVQDHFKPTQIIDLATLTGGIVIALGEEASGLFATDDRLANMLEKAGEKTFERVWRFPLYPEYKEALKSPIADLKNSADRKASSITGATFIQAFVKKVPWAHLDIAGTAYLSAPRHYHCTPATGVGVRLLIEFFASEV